jgi:adenine phosphoribosyltransferase
MAQNRRGTVGHDRHMSECARKQARRAVLRNFRWRDGHADVWSVFSDAEALVAVVTALADPWRADGVTRVIGIESRGFILGGAVAVALGVGFVAVRKPGTLLPGPTLEVQAGADYRGNRHVLRVQREVFHSTDRVVLVDDWAERGAQARAARDLVESSGATFGGVSVMVDQLDDDVRADLRRVSSIVLAGELPGSDAA